jgi:hypothetical protein
MIPDVTRGDASMVPNPRTGRAGDLLTQGQVLAPPSASGHGSLFLLLTPREEVRGREGRRPMATGWAMLGEEQERVRTCLGFWFCILRTPSRRLRETQGIPEPPGYIRLR